MEEEKPFKKLPQILCALIITIGGFNLGTAIGWSAPAESSILEDLEITPQEFSWIASGMPIGAAFSQFITAFLMDCIGRKFSLIILSAFAVIAWVLLSILPYYLSMIMSRVLIGLCVGGYCVVCPCYIGEFAHKSLRGLLSSFFQFQVVIGIVIAFAFAFVDNIYYFNIFAAFFPLTLMLLVMFFVPESPSYHLIKNREDKAKRSLQFFRGDDYDISDELEHLKTVSEAAPFCKSLKEPASKVGIIILLGLHIIQQITGINAFMYYVHAIIEKTHPDISSKTSSLLIGVVQVVMTGVAVVTVDKIGRKILWYVSIVLMALSLLVNGVYFSIEKQHQEGADKGHSAGVSFIPIAAIATYIAGFSIGAGPLPWAMIGELLAVRVKAKAATFIAFINWLLAFVIITLFPIIGDTIGYDVVCYFFVITCIVSFIFIFFIVIETKGLTLEEIQQKLENYKLNVRGGGGGGENSSGGTDGQKKV